jgi:hypothetical protein
MRGGIAAAISAAIRIAALAVVASCGAANDQTKTPGLNPHTVNGEAAPAASNKGTRVITNLSQLSSAPSAIPSISAQNLVSGAAALHDTAPRPNEAQKLADSNLEHLYLSKQHSIVHGGEARAAGDRTLLNAKARQFAEFAYALLNQTLAAAQELEAGKLEEHKLPDEIKPMILTAMMTPEGKLTDIAVEQHSGVGAVDRIIIDACKKGLWTMNPPKAALADDGMFRMRIEGVVNNYSYDLEGNYHYITHLGLALL